MAWTVVEDKALDGLDYKEAREGFDVWVKEDGEGMEKSKSAADWRGSAWPDETKFQHWLDAEPRRSFFVFVDEEAVR